MIVMRAMALRKAKQASIPKFETTSGKSLKDTSRSTYRIWG